MRKQETYSCARQKPALTHLQNLHFARGPLHGLADGTNPQAKHIFELYVPRGTPKYLG
jgi:hypothetical protein